MKCIPHTQQYDVDAWTWGMSTILSSFDGEMMVTHWDIVVFSDKATYYY